MLARIPAVRFVLAALLGFVILMSIAPAKFYPPLFRGVANFFFHSFGSDRIAKFEAFDDPSEVSDTKISIGREFDGVPAYRSSMGINCVREGYAPMAALIALVLATPTPWRSRCRSLAIGLLLVQAFVALRIVVAAMYGFSRARIGDHHLLDVGSFGIEALHRADQILTGDLHLTYLAPLLIWLLVAVPPGAVRALWAK